MRKTIVTTEVVCEAPDGIFGEWGTMTPELQALFEAPGDSIPCEGQGAMGDWCTDCRWGHVEVVDYEREM